jgi:hypothetical protein
MPNHLHALIGFQNIGKSTNTIIDNGKRFMAYEIVDRLEKQNETLLLEQLQQVEGKVSTILLETEIIYALKTN